MKKDHLEILLEDMNSKFELVLEGHEVLRKEIGDLDRKNDERFDMVDLKFDALNEKVDHVDKRLGTKIDAVADDLAAHRRDTEAHKGGYKAMDE